MADAVSLGALLGNLAGVGPAAGTEGSGGVAGLFGQLIQATEGLLVDPSGSQLAELETELGAGLLSDLLPEVAPLLEAPLLNVGAAIPGQALQVGGLAVELTGETEAVRVLSQTIDILYQKITIQGYFQPNEKGGVGNLAAALTRLGLPAEEAQALAAQIDTMLELLKQQLAAQKDDLAGAEGASLVAVLLASLLNQQQAQTLQVPATQTTTLTQIEVKITQVQVQVSSASWQQLQARSQGPLALQPPQGNQGQPIIFKQPEAAQPALQVTALPQPTGAALSEANTAGPGNPILQIALPTAPEALAQPEANRVVALPTVQPVPAPKPLEGVALYKLTEGQQGTPILQVLAVKQPVALEAVPGAPEASQETPVATAQPPEATLVPAASVAIGLVPAPATATPNLPNAALFERIVQAQQAQAGQQVSIAIQPLLNSGQGGAVQIVLNPPELGKIEVHLKIENGQITGQVQAQDAGVLEHLARELPALRQSFMEAGLKLGDQGLSLMLGNPQQEQQQAQNPFANPQEQQNKQPQRGSQEGNGTLSAEAILSATGKGASRWVAPDQLVDFAA